MSLITRMRRQVATYWAPLPANNFGRVTYDVPVQISCRWEDVNEQFMDANGRTVVSNAKVYVDRALALGGILCKVALADVTDAEKPFDNVGAYEIKRVGEMPNLKATEVLREVML